ncbi:MAG: hypothetical protein EBZ48_00340 [Proteobacteria bacterium]|nr:hypothetical protein [Pseudomonadota bacterium]
MTALVQELTVDTARCEAALIPELFAADIANELVATGKSFRDAYREVKAQLGSISVSNTQQFIGRKTHTGAPGNPGLEQLEQELCAARAVVALKAKSFEDTIAKLF